MGTSIYYWFIIQVQDIIITEIYLPINMLDKENLQNRKNGKQNEEIQPKKTFFNKYFSFNHLKMILRYRKELSNENLITFNQEYQDIIEDHSLWTRYLRSAHKFKLTLELFKMQAFPIILLVILSIFTGLLTLIPPYYQKMLVGSLLGSQTGDQTKYILIIMGSLLLKYFIFNYTQSLSINIAINNHVSLENAFMKSIFSLKKQTTSANLKKIFFSDIENVKEALIYLPYLIISTVTILGIVAIIFEKISTYAYVVLGTLLIVFLIILILAILLYKRGLKKIEIAEQRILLSSFALSSLLRLHFQQLKDVFLRNLLKLRKLQLFLNKKYSIIYVLMQGVGECVSIVSLILLFFMCEHSSSLAKIEVYTVALMLMNLYSPIKITVYGLFRMVQGFQAINSLKDAFRKRITKDQSLKFESRFEKCKMAQDIGLGWFLRAKRLTCSSEAAKLIQKNEISEIEQVKKGNTLMIIGRVDSKPQQYLNQLINKIAISSPQCSICVLRNSPLIIDQTIKNNIILQKQYDHDKYLSIIRKLEIETFINELTLKSDTVINSKSFKFFDWLSLRIQLARVLYNQVDYFIIQRHIMSQDADLIEQIINIRKKSNLTNIILNGPLSYIKQDLVKVLGPKNAQKSQMIQTGYPEKLTKIQNSMLNEHIKLYKIHSNKQISIDKQQHENVHCTEEISNKEQNEKENLNYKKSTYYKFYNLAHRGAGLIIALFLIIPLLLRTYLQIVISKSLKNDVFRQFTIVGITYLIMVIIRGIILSSYLQKSSLKLFTSIMNKFSSLSANKVMKLFMNFDVTTLQNDIKEIDGQMTMNFELGMSLMYEQIISFVLAILISPLFLTVSVPVGLINVTIMGIYLKIIHWLVTEKEKEYNKTNKLVQNAIDNSKSIIEYRQSNWFFRRFTQLNSKNIMYECNNQWVLSGCRRLNQILIIILTTLFFILLTTILKDNRFIDNKPFMGITVGFLISLPNALTFSLKINKHLDRQLVAVSRSLNILQSQPQPSKPIESTNNISEIEQITYKNVSMIFDQGQLVSDASLKLLKGERVAVSGGQLSGKSTLFYELFKIFEISEVRGQILINGNNLKDCNLSKNNLLRVLHKNPPLPANKTVSEVIREYYIDITDKEIDQGLSELWKVLEIGPLFSSRSRIQYLTIAEKQLLILSVGVFLHPQKCGFLLIVGGLTSLDIISRVKLMKYLINKPQISIMVQVTNQPQICELYNRNILFRKGKIIQDITKNIIQ